VPGSIDGNEVVPFSRMSSRVQTRCPPKREKFGHF
jgi:hypothetical protein